MWPETAGWTKHYKPLQKRGAKHGQPRLALSAVRRPNRVMNRRGAAFGLLPLRYERVLTGDDFAA
jgi:hypothetical protein